MMNAVTFGEEANPMTMGIFVYVLMTWDSVTYWSMTWLRLLWLLLSEKGLIDYYRVEWMTH